MAIRAVFFDVGETLVDEERYWRELAERWRASSRTSSGPRSGSRSSAGRSTTSSGDISESSGPRRLGHDLTYESATSIPTRSPCLAALRRPAPVGLAGNQNAALEEWAGSSLPADVSPASASLGVRKPDPRFFERSSSSQGRTPAEVAYVGDRADNDVLPALTAGLVAVHIRRGPWGMLQATPPGAVSVASLAELPGVVLSPGS